MEKQLGIAGATHLAHAPGADFGQDLVGTDFATYSNRHITDSIWFTRFENEFAPG
jgi:hypothetical protein